MRADIVTYNLLTETAEIAAELTKAFPLVVPNSVSLAVGNFITYSVVNTDAVTTKTSWNDYDRVLIQLSFFSTSYNDNKNLADLVRAKFDRFKGMVSNGDDDYFVDLIQFRNQEDLGFDADNEVFMVAQDYLISITKEFVGTMGFEEWANGLSQYFDDDAAIAGGIVVNKWYFNLTLNTVVKIMN
jgi:hypothetical protein